MRKFTITEQISLISQYITNYRSVEAFPYLSREEIREYQFQKIQRLVDIAYRQTDFYHKKYSEAGIHPRDIQTWGDFKELPIITKDEVIEFGLDMVDRRRKPSDLIVSRSSGSSGRFVNLYFDAQHFITQELQVIRMLKEFYPAYNLFDTELLIYTSEYPFSSIAGFYKVFYVNNLLPVDEIIAAIRRVRPAIVAVYPSILREVIDRFEGDCRSFGVKAVITNSEHSSQMERDNFSEVLGCPVFDEYSSEEISGLAHQCVHENYHLVQDCSFIELLDPHGDIEVGVGQEGEIVGTSLINFSMPLIRYRQGDLAVMSANECACGKTTPFFERLAGRKNSSFKRPDNSYIPSGRVLDWTYDLVLSLELDIREFQVTQKTLTDVEIVIVPGNRYNPESDNVKIMNSFQDTFSQEFKVSVDQVEKIRKTKTGKHIPIRSLV
ncbi:MAG: hypothetical protein OEZ02_04140 [Anaerolineae bacterium]|nr:hypothetical protein [Anaerolineae bacterium]